MLDSIEIECYQYWNSNDRLKTHKLSSNCD